MSIDYTNRNELLKQMAQDFEQEGRSGRFPYTSAPIRVWTRRTLATAMIDAGLKPKQVAILTETPKVDVYHFIHRRFHKISRKKKAELLQWFRSAGFLPYPVPRPRCVCPHCGRAHNLKPRKEQDNGKEQ